MITTPRNGWKLSDLFSRPRACSRRLGSQGPRSRRNAARSVNAPTCPNRGRRPSPRSEAVRNAPSVRVFDRKFSATVDSMIVDDIGWVAYAATHRPRVASPRPAQQARRRENPADAIRALKFYFPVRTVTNTGSG